MLKSVLVIIPEKLYISSHQFAENNLQELKILNILRLGDPDDFEDYYVTYNDITYHNIILKDELSSILTIEMLDEATDWIYNTNGSVLVHCFAGISRSSAIILAYLMKYKKMSYDKAWKYLLQHHPSSAPNPKFVRDLLSYELYLKSKI